MSKIPLPADPCLQNFTNEVTLVVVVKLIKYKTACEVEIVICLLTSKDIIGFHCTYLIVYPLKF